MCSVNVPIITHCLRQGICWICLCPSRATMSAFRRDVSHHTCISLCITCQTWWREAWQYQAIQWPGSAIFIAINVLIIVEMCNYYYFYIGVEKNNDDAKQNYYSSNRHDAADNILRTEARLDKLRRGTPECESCVRQKRKYEKSDFGYWEGGILAARKRPHPQWPRSHFFLQFFSKPPTITRFSQSVITTSNKNICKVNMDLGISVEKRNKTRQGWHEVQKDMSEKHENYWSLIPTLSTAMVIM